MIGRLPPGSRLRQAFLSRSVQLAVEAYNRRDLDAALIGYDSEFEYFPPRSWVELGLVEQCYRGADGYRRYEASFAEAWGAANAFEPVELIDLGERIVLLADAPMRGKGSGVPVTTAYANVSTLKDGLVIRMQEYMDHAEALEAVGLAGRRPEFR
jgi:ketosteroid isomerase-like protein